MYWPGNAAKAFTIRRLLDDAAGRDVTVLDHGCGGGGDWPAILSENPNVRLVAWDPYTAANIPGADVRTCFPDDIVADYVVSFSVLEHVRDRFEYLRQARDALGKGGVFYLNYDDGHFRIPIDPDDGLRRCARAVARVVLNAVAARRTGPGFQRRVTVAEADSLIEAVGFTVERVWYHNVEAFKRLAKTIPPHRADEFAAFWLSVEDRLNSDFAGRSPDERRGDTSTLWEVAASRTLLLRRQEHS